MKWNFENYDPKEKKTFPKLVCHACGHRNQLDFSPISNPDLLYSVQCERCSGLAYQMTLVNERCSFNYSGSHSGVKEGKLHLPDKMII